MKPWFHFLMANNCQYTACEHMSHLVDNARENATGLRQNLVVKFNMVSSQWLNTKVLLYTFRRKAEIRHTSVWRISDIRRNLSRISLVSQTSGSLCPVRLHLTEPDEQLDTALSAGRDVWGHSSVNNPHTTCLPDCLSFSTHITRLVTSAQYGGQWRGPPRTSLIRSIVNSNFATQNKVGCQHQNS